MAEVIKVSLDDMGRDAAISYLMTTLGIPEDQAIMIHGFHTNKVKGDALDQDGEDLYQGLTLSKSGAVVVQP
jgi:hypothetical protein